MTTNDGMSMKINGIPIDIKKVAITKVHYLLNGNMSFIIIYNVKG